MNAQMGATRFTPTIKASVNQLFAYFWGAIAHPRRTFEDLSYQASIRPAVMLVTFGLLVGYLNILLFSIFGYDWLGTRRELANPTYVGFFGYLRVDAEHWVSIFSLLNLLLALLGLVVTPGLAHLLSKLWHGQGSFEAMVNTMIFAVEVPAIAIRGFSELLTGVPFNLLTGNPYAFTTALYGGFGPVVQVIWNIFVIGIYTILHDAWIIVLGTLAIRQVERIPWWAAGLIMTVSYVLWMYGITASFVR